MTRSQQLLAVLLAPLLLGGCLLPQPDTPPVPPLTSRSAKSPVGAAPALPQPDTPPITPAKPVTTGSGAEATGAESGTKLIPQPDTPPVTPLLPQPDTPPVGAGVVGHNGSSAVSTGANAAPLANNNASVGTSDGAGLVNSALPAVTNNGGLPAASGPLPTGHSPTTTLAPAPAASVAPVTPGVLAGTLIGLRVLGVDVTDATGATLFQTVAVGSDGAFSFKLAPGDYKLVLKTADKKLAVGTLFTVKPGETHSYTITLDATASGATVAENVPLSDSAGLAP